MDCEMLILDVTEKMDKTIENLEKKFTTVRAGRANPSSLLLEQEELILLA